MKNKNLLPESETRGRQSDSEIVITFILAYLFLFFNCSLHIFLFWKTAYRIGRDVSNKQDE